MTEAASAGRPAVTVVVPFAGSLEDARALVTSLGALSLAEGDEVIVVDNSTDHPLATLRPGSPVRVVCVDACGSSYHARNVGAGVARADWLLFLDADCRPSPRLLDELFAAPIGSDVGALAGATLPAAGQGALVARYARARRHVDQDLSLGHPFRPFAATANLMVRRAAFEEVGGFCEVRAGGDVDFSWRLQEAGWRLDSRPRATVEHRHREHVVALWRQISRYGTGSAWVERRFAGTWPKARPVASVLRALAGGAVAAARGRREESAFRALDAVAAAAHAAGALRGNGARCGGGSAPLRGEGAAHGFSPVRVGGGRGAVVLVDALPDRVVEREVEALRAAGWSVRVEAVRRVGVRAPDAGGPPTDWLEDEGPADRAAAALWVLGRRAARLWRQAPRARRLLVGGERRVHAVGSVADAEARRMLRALGGG